MSGRMDEINFLEPEIFREFGVSHMVGCDPERSVHFPHIYGFATKVMEIRCMWSHSPF